MEAVVTIISVIIVTGFVVLFIRMNRTKELEQKIDIQHVNENSFQNFAKFYGEIYPDDPQFDRKLNKIYILITDHNIMDIKRIAEISLCTLPECVIKIKYLKNKRLIDNLYIDTVNMELIPCSDEDQLLLDKYKPFLYGSHLQVEGIASVIPNPKGLSADSLRDEIFKEILYLNNKGLINGIKVDEIDHRILYYTIEKRRIYEDHQTVHCPNCGALNDVDITGKVRCSYCNSIVYGDNAIKDDMFS